MPCLDVVVIDAMTFSYLQGLRRLDLLGEVGERSRKLVVTKAVIGQLHRSGRLGSWVEEACDRGMIRRESPVVGDEVSTAVAEVLRHKNGLLVRRNRTDVELVEVAKHGAGCVLTRESGIVELARRRRTSSIDLLVFFLWAARLGLIADGAVVEATAPWWTQSGPGTGAPPDVADSLATMVARRGVFLTNDLDGLMAVGVARPPSWP